MSAAARSEDGRGPRTSLVRSVPGHFGLETPVALAEAIHRDEIPQRRVIELARLVLNEAGHDAVAAEIVGRLVEEVVALARVALTRLGLQDEPVEVLLGGGLLQSADAELVAAIAAGLAEVGPSIAVRSNRSPAIVGAALLGLDDLGAVAEAQARLREELGAAVQRVEKEAILG